MGNEFKDVIEFNKTIIGLSSSDYLCRERLDWFKKVINEELSEFETANLNYISTKINAPRNSELLLKHYKAEMFDAIIDLIYFAYGRLYELGAQPEAFEQMWNAVHRANMKKKKGNKGRGSDLDAIKPEGWEAPEKKFPTMSSSVEDAEHPLEKSTQYSEMWDDFEGKLESSEWSHVYIGPIGPLTSRTNCKKPNMPSVPSLGTKVGIKLDNGKNNLSLVFRGFSKSLPEVAWIGTFGANKYAPNDWQKVENLQERYESGLLRHYFALINGEEFDTESGRQHLAHLAWNALALSQHNFSKMSPEQYTEYQNNAKKLEQEHFKKLEQELHYKVAREL